MASRIRTPDRIPASCGNLLGRECLDEVQDFPIGDARYEAQFIPRVQLAPIPSLWGHPAGAGASPADKRFLNEKIATFLAEGGERR